MFCDLVGSTSLAAKLDAEDWRDLVNAYLDAASAAVTEMGGHVPKKLGDGLMALFGYPHRAGERRRARGARGARDPARARRAQRQERRQRRAGACRPHRPRNPARWWSMRRARFTATRQHRGAGAGAGRAGRGAGHGAGAAPGRRAVCRGRARHARAQGRAGADRRCSASFARAAAAARRRARNSRRSSAATRKWRC